MTAWYDGWQVKHIPVLSSSKIHSLNSQMTQSFTGCGTMWDQAWPPASTDYVITYTTYIVQKEYFSNTVSQIIHNTAPFKAHQKHLEETATTDSMTEFHDQQYQRQQWDQAGLRLKRSINRCWSLMISVRVKHFFFQIFCWKKKTPQENGL